MSYTYARCPDCGEEIIPNVPIIGFCYVGARCRKCGKSVCLIQRNGNYELYTSSPEQIAAGRARTIQLSDEFERHMERGGRL